MDIPLQTADRLHQEAGDLLSSMGLMELLAQYGAPHLTGSYDYDLMTWRDIDLCVEVASVDKGKVFELGKSIALFPHTATMYFRDELVLKTAGNPQGIFWCVEVLPPGSPLWKIDILFATPDEIRKILQQRDEIKGNLTPALRRVILEVKAPLSQRAEYRRSFRSVDIYHAVIHEGIRTLAEWEAWWQVNPRSV